MGAVANVLNNHEFALHDPIARILRTQPVVVLDGALATELERRGCDLQDPLWSARVLLEAPEVIRQVHGDYFAAGADCAITASYQATFQGFAQWLDRYPQMAALGVNCTAPHFVPDLIRAAAGVTRKPIVAYPNSGESYDAQCGTWRGTVKREGFGALAQQWYDSGARVIGGCCRTPPDDIRAVVAQLRGGVGGEVRP